MRGLDEDVKSGDMLIMVTVKRWPETTCLKEVVYVERVTPKTKKIVLTNGKRFKMNGWPEGGKPSLTTPTTYSYLRAFDKDNPGQCFCVPEPEQKKFPTCDGPTAPPEG